MKEVITHGKLDSEPQRSRGAVIRTIQELVPKGAPKPSEPFTLSRLTQLTSELIDVSGGIGALAAVERNPYTEVLERRLAVEPSVTDRLRGKKILITGGEGLVGQQLIKQLTEDFSVGSITSVDIARRDDLYGETDQTVSYRETDIRDMNALKTVFKEEKPDIVFHLAAISEVGQSQDQKAATIGTNVFGTRNLIEVAEETGVEDFVYSSTGKAAQYVTHGIFGSTVKVVEGELAAAAQRPDSGVRYSMARFTHVVENSNLVNDINKGIADGMVFLHTPDRYFYAQSVEEASTSLLNSMVISEKGKLKFGSVQNIGLPVNNLDIALHLIAKSGSVVPIYFAGVETGYDPETFNGQLNIKKAFQMGEEPSVMANVLETENMTVTETGDTIVAEMAPFDTGDFSANLALIEANLSGTKASEEGLVSALDKTIIDMTTSQFDKTSPQVLANILRWGTASADPKIHATTFLLLLKSLQGRVTSQMLEEKLIGAPPTNKMLEILESTLSPEQLSSLLN